MTGHLGTAGGIWQTGDNFKHLAAGKTLVMRRGRQIGVAHTDARLAIPVMATRSGHIAWCSRVSGLRCSEP